MTSARNHVSSNAMPLPVIQTQIMTNNIFVRLTILQQNYLMNFGYLPKTDIETGNLRSESQLIDAIKTLQVSLHDTALGALYSLFPFVTDNRQHSCHRTHRRADQTSDDATALWPSRHWKCPRLLRRQPVPQESQTIRGLGTQVGEDGSNVEVCTLPFYQRLVNHHRHVPAMWCGDSRSRLSPSLIA